MVNSNDFVGLKAHKLSINDVVDMVVSPNCGAISTFIGTTRNNFEQKKVLKLEYEAYEPMAIKEMYEVCSKIRSKWDVEKIAIFHRLGEVPVSEASVIIAISSPHRKESLESVQYAIDTIKASVPIWKKEVYDDDTHEPQWKQNKECSWTDSDLSSQNRILYSNIKSEHNYFQNIFDDDDTVDILQIAKHKKSSNLTANCSNNHNNLINRNYEIDPEQVQIKASTEELNRRIESFIARKREQANLVNIQEFCSNSYQAASDSEEEDYTYSCARVNAIVHRRKDSKSHVKVHRVYNKWEQQTANPNYFCGNPDSSNSYSTVLDERISSAEKILGITKPVPPDIYERIKIIEDRLRYLESISPEYKDLWILKDDNSDTETYKKSRKRTLSTADFNCKMPFDGFENGYQKRFKQEVNSTFGRIV